MLWGKDILQGLRLRRGMTQESLATAMNMSVAWVAKQEAKATYDEPPKMHDQTASKLAEVLGIPLEQLRAPLYASGVIDPASPLATIDKLIEWIRTLNPEQQKAVRTKLWGFLDQPDAALVTHVASEVAPAAAAATVGQKSAAHRARQRAARRTTGT
jgi:transcriptional regulator with XRE-family HTH domain